MGVGRDGEPLAHRAGAVDEVAGLERPDAGLGLGVLVGDRVRQRPRLGDERRRPVPGGRRRLPDGRDEQVEPQARGQRPVEEAVQPCVAAGVALHREPQRLVADRDQHGELVVAGVQGRVEGLVEGVLQRGVPGLAGPAHRGVAQGAVAEQARAGPVGGRRERGLEEGDRLGDRPPAVGLDAGLHLRGGEAGRGEQRRGALAVAQHGERVRVVVEPLEPGEVQVRRADRRHAGPQAVGVEVVAQHVAVALAGGQPRPHRDLEVVGDVERATPEDGGQSGEVDGAQHRERLDRPPRRGRELGGLVVDDGPHLVGDPVDRLQGLLPARAAPEEVEQRRDVEGEAPGAAGHRVREVVVRLERGEAPPDEDRHRVGGERPDGDGGDGVLPVELGPRAVPVRVRGGVGCPRRDHDDHPGGQAATGEGAQDVE